MRNQEWDAALAQLHPLDLAELVLSLLASDAVDSETALGVVDKAEVLASLLDRNDVHEASRVGRVGADLAIDLDQALHDNGLHLATIEGVLQTAKKLALVSILACYSLFLVPGKFLVAYRLRMKTMSGMQSRSLCGPGEALGA
jgi:hypothetical protein